jgi:hypothetical protein
MKDGLYIVDYHNIYGAFVIRGGEVRNCAPILRNRIDYFKKIAKWIPTMGDPVTLDEVSEDQYPPLWRVGCV